MAFDGTQTRLGVSNNTVLVCREVPEVECAYNVSSVKQGLPHACHNRVIVAAPKRGVWVGDYGRLRFAEEARVTMLFWMVQATV